MSEIDSLDGVLAQLEVWLTDASKVIESSDKNLAETVAAPFAMAIGPVVRSVRDASGKEPKNATELKRIFNALSDAWYDLNITGEMLKRQ